MFCWQRIVSEAWSSGQLSVKMFTQFSGFCSMWRAAVVKSRLYMQTSWIHCCSHLLWEDSKTDFNQHFLDASCLHYIPTISNHNQEAFWRTTSSSSSSSRVLIQRRLKRAGTVQGLWLVQGCRANDSENCSYVVRHPAQHTTVVCWFELAELKSRVSAW